MTLLSVPIIDLAPYFAGTAEGKAEVAKKVDEACRSIGFLVIMSLDGTGIAVPVEEVPRLVAQQSRERPLGPVAVLHADDRVG